MKHSCISCFKKTLYKIFKKCSNVCLTKYIPLCKSLTNIFFPYKNRKFGEHSSHYDPSYLQRKRRAIWSSWCLSYVWNGLCFTFNGGMYLFICFIYHFGLKVLFNLHGIRGRRTLAILASWNYKVFISTFTI